MEKGLISQNDEDILIEFLHSMLNDRANDRRLFDKISDISRWTREGKKWDKQNRMKNQRLTKNHQVNQLSQKGFQKKETFLYVTKYGEKYHFESTCKGFNGHPILAQKGMHNVQRKN